MIGTSYRILPSKQVGAMFKGSAEVVQGKVSETIALLRSREVYMVEMSDGILS